MLSRSWLVGLLSFTWLVGCSSGSVEKESETQQLPIVEIMVTPIATPTKSTTPTLTTTLSAESEIPRTPTPAVSLCSPLAIHPLEELPQIIGDPYKPPPPNKAEERHHGIDFGYYHWQERDTMLGEPVQVVLSGVVAAAIHDLYPYGNMVIIETQPGEHPTSLRTRLDFLPGEALYLLYAHLHLAPLVTLGEKVEACQPLGVVGMSGNTDIPHLHLETRIGPAGAVFESMRFYDTRASQVEMDNYVRWRTSGEFRHFDPMVLFSHQLYP